MGRFEGLAIFQRHNAEKLSFLLDISPEPVVAILLLLDFDRCSKNAFTPFSLKPPFADALFEMLRRLHAAPEDTSGQETR
jgi:hypothetical protein